jgi:hypothetical protein
MRQQKVASRRIKSVRYMHYNEFLLGGAWMNLSDHYDMKSSSSAWAPRWSAGLRLVWERE